MKQFSAWQYLLIDVSNNFGLDKLLFEERIQWAQDHLQELESLSDKAESQPLYKKAVMALRKAQKGIPTGHLVALDACCSGLQLMSVVTGCVAGATATGLVDPEVRADAYTIVTKEMNNILGGGLSVSRADAKRSVMTLD
jgi:DNA-directed RNA polymerase